MKAVSFESLFNKTWVMSNKMKLSFTNLNNNNNNDNDDNNNNNNNNNE